MTKAHVVWLMMIVWGAGVAYGVRALLVLLRGDGGDFIDRASHDSHARRHETGILERPGDLRERVLTRQSPDAD